MALLFKRPVRKLLAVNKDTEGYRKQAQERYLLGLVQRHPMYKNIIAALAEGVTPTQIARHFAQSGFIDIHEKLFYQALIKFRRTYPELITTDKAASSELDKMIDPKAPPMDVRQNLMQLVRVQKDRIAVGLNFEKNSNFIVQFMHKEVGVAREILETIARLDGKIGESATRKAMDSGFTSDVAENLGNIRRDQGSRDRIHSLVREVIDNSNETDNRKKQTVETE